MKPQEGAEPTETEKQQAAEHAATTAELRAASAAFDALYKLDRGARGRVMRWLEARLDNCANYYGEPPF